MNNLLKQISTNAIALNPYNFTEEEKQQLWIGREPCTDEAIAKAEKRLGISLPDDVKEFYKVSNGTSVVLKNTFGGFMPIEKIDWLVNIQKETLTDYGEMPESYLEDLRNVIIISGIHDTHQIFIIQPYGENTAWRYWEFALYILGEYIHNSINNYLEKLNDFLTEQIKNKKNEETK